MTKVLVVDDSVFMRTVIRDMVAKDPSLEVVGTAIDGVDALKKIEALTPDIITLDIEMPRMSGIEVLEKIGRLKDRPRILMLSSLTAKDAEMTHRAIDLGADDFMLKPADLPHVREIGDELVMKLKHLMTLPRAIVQPGQKAVPVPEGAGTPASRVILIGSSAGGPQMLDRLLADIPADLPAGVVVTQHMPVGFTGALAARFNRISKMPVRESENGDVIETGRILLSRAGVHTIVTRHLSDKGCVSGKLVHTTAPPVHGVRPAVDKTFSSAAQVFGRNAVTAVLSGMGNDAGEGAAAIREAGGKNFVCDEKDCLVYGMARSVISHKAADATFPLDRMGRELAKVVLKMEEPCV
ncbi:MAG TPA: chemotaxis-specific protein-glutamate methyltransferase CheB [Methanoregula sp.]|nr:chemotaxis-specific protein-glutamate methyltransferase CheB [Methanoregula sp.]